MKKYPAIMTIKQIREYLQLSKNKAYELVNLGKLPAFKIDNMWRVKKEDVDKFIEDRKRKGDS